MTPNRSQRPQRQPRRRTTPRQVPRRRNPQSTSATVNSGAPAEGNTPTKQPTPPTHATTNPNPNPNPNPDPNPVPNPDANTDPNPAPDSDPGAQATTGNARWAPTPEALFLTRAPLLRHIPSRTRKQMADVWQAEWRAFIHVKGDNEEDKARALLRIFALPACILLSPPKQRHRDSPQAPQAIRHLIRERLKKWQQGATKQLWHMVTQRARRAADKRSCATPIRAKRLDRVKRLAQECAYAKAIRALGASGVHAPTPAVQRTLENKHPQTTPATDGIHDIDPDDETLPTIPKIKPFSSVEVLKAAKKFPRGSAAGGSGLSPTNLMELLHSPSADNTNGLREVLAKGLSILADGRGPPSLSQWISGAPLTALRKEDNGVRPIAVGETLRRLTSSMLLTRNAELARKLLTPHQVGVATPGGCEAVVHAVRHLTHEHQQDNRIGLLQLDLKNAFNLVSRAAFRSEVRKHMPELHGWVQYCYGPNTAPELWIGEYRLRSVCGVQQGDPLGPLLFTLALRPVLLRLSEKLSEWREEALANDMEIDQGKETPSMLSFYLDDGVIVDRHEVLQRALGYMNSDEARSYGLHLCVQKCNLWWPKPPTSESDDGYPVALNRIRQPCHSVLKAPIGGHRQLVERVDAQVARMEQTFNDIVEIDDAQTTLALLRVTMGVCQINYLLRTVPASATKRGAQRFDELTYGAINKMVGGTLATDIFRELQLPLRPIDKTTHTLGIGLQSAVATAPAAYLASTAQTNHLVRKMTNCEQGSALCQNWFASQTHNLLRIYTRNGDTPSLDEISSNPIPTQRELTQLINRKTWDDIPKGTQRTIAFRATMSLPGAKDWVKAPPCPALQTHVNNHRFKAWMRYYTQTPFRNRGVATCPRPGCAKELDLFGDHLLICPHSSLVGSANVTTRHNRQVRLLAEELSKAARNPVIEPKQREDQSTRPDIKATGKGGGDDLIDISIVHPFSAQTTRDRTIADPFTTTRYAYNAKLRKHRQLLDAQTGGSIVPIVLSACGGWEPRSHEYARNLVRETSTRADTEARYYTALFFQRHAIRLICSNATALTHDPRD